MSRPRDINPNYRPDEEGFKPAIPHAGRLRDDALISRKSPLHAEILKLKDFAIQEELWAAVERFDLQCIDSSEDIATIFGGLNKLIIFDIVDVKKGDLLRKIVSNYADQRQAYLATELPANMVKQWEQAFEKFVTSIEQLLALEIGQERAAKFIQKARSLLEGAE
jgi:hypothetical protein